MFERYTKSARQVIFFAYHEAAQFGSPTTETEHLLLGLICEDKNLMNRFLRNHSSAEAVRKEIEGRNTIRGNVWTDIGRPLSAECKRILAYAADEAERLSSYHIGAEHLLLAILGEENCAAAEILQQHGLRLDAIREELARSLPELPKSGLVPDADTAKRIAESLWIPKYGADTVASQAPIQAELKFNLWIVTGSSSTDAPLYAYILRDGRILSIGRADEP
jgi:ATP-dependent Clp protease ATP-binding subunit ClpA